MALFKDVKKPVIKQHGAEGSDVSSGRPAYVAKAAPCIHSCPSGTDIRGWLVPLAQYKDYGRTPEQAFEAAWRAILENNPFPAVCGRVCQHPCELNCNRKAKDGAVSINKLEQFLGDFAVEHGLLPDKPDPHKATGTRIAIVGAGPAGLSAAYHLARAGHSVTIFDAAPEAGGLMRYSIPRSTIPAATLDAEIANILHLGVELRLNCLVGRDIAMDQLQRDYQAVFIAMGLQKPAQLAVVPGGDGRAFTIGVLPAEPPAIPQEAPARTEPRVLNTVSVAIAQGRSVAQTIVAQFQCCAVQTDRPATVIRSDRLKLDWYKTLPRFENREQLMTEAEALAEAARCMSCGMCMDCETCWMYCSKNCFIKLPKGEHYKIKIDLCNGCGKCASSCPCGYIEMN
jgi:Pyruvate/2-oxoacid:ferredoxin oxidoreductase delta subunit